MRVVAKRLPSVPGLLPLFFFAVRNQILLAQAISFSDRATFCRSATESGQVVCPQPATCQDERFCPKCLLRTLGGKPIYRGGQGDLSDAMKILPGQWPPLDCQQHLLNKYKGAPDTDMETSPTVPETSSLDRPFQALSLPLFQAEKLKLEKHILDLPDEGFGPLREQLEQPLAAATREIGLRRTAGQTLDQALARHKAACRAKTLAEEHLQQAEQSLARAQESLQQATEAEAQAAQKAVQAQDPYCKEDSAERVKTQSGSTASHGTPFTPGISASSTAPSLQAQFQYFSTLYFKKDIVQSMIIWRMLDVQNPQSEQET